MFNWLRDVWTPNAPMHVLPPQGEPTFFLYPDGAYLSGRHYELIYGIARRTYGDGRVAWVLKQKWAGKVRGEEISGWEWREEFPTREAAEKRLAVARARAGQEERDRIRWSHTDEDVVE